MKKIILLSFLVLLLACSKKQVTVPNDVLPLGKMSSILTEIHLAQSALSINSINDSSKKTMRHYFPFILKKNEISNADFLQSLHFYSEHPELLSQIYDSVLVNISNLQGELERN